jgi:hypothetical protein
MRGVEDVGVKTAYPVGGPFTKGKVVMIASNVAVALSTAAVKPADARPSSSIPTINQTHDRLNPIEP